MSVLALVAVCACLSAWALPKIEGFPTAAKESASLAADAGWWKIDAPKDVHTSIWREKDGTLAIHFLNMVGAVPKRGEKLVREAGPSVFGPVGQDVRFTVPEGRRVVAVSPRPNGDRPQKE